MNKKKIIAIIIATVVFFVAVFAWSAWRKSVTAKQNEQPQTEVTDTQTENQNVSKSDNEKLAKKFELALRNWGVDSTIDPAALAKKDAGEVLATLRTPELGESPVQDMLGFTPDSKVGPNAASEFCTGGYQGACQSTPTMQNEIRNEFWGIGSRWTDGPNISVADDGTVTVTGKIKTILVTSGDTFQMGDYHALTPAWEERNVKDKLTIKDGKIASISYDGNRWWTNPWLTEWKPADAVTQIGYGTRTVIPVKGSLSWDGLNPSGTINILYAPVTQADDMHGKFDWTLWDGISANTGGDSPQQAPGLDPEKDAATLQDRL